LINSLKTVPAEFQTSETTINAISRKSSNLFFVKMAYREAMLRYRAGDALRTKATAAIASNRLLLIYTQHARWLAYLSTQQNIINTGDTALMANTSFFCAQLTHLQRTASYLFRDAAVSE
jgi:hypothetical protein